MESLIARVIANYFDTSKETQTQRLAPNYNSHTFNDYVDYDQQELKNIIPVLIKKKKPSI
jgi:hypothetical protein